MSSNDPYNMPTTFSEPPTAKAPSERQPPKLMEAPCQLFQPADGFPEKCGCCGHAPEAHTVISTTGRAKVIADGRTSRIMFAESTKEKLDPGFYVLMQDQSGFYLRHFQGIDMPPKVYGKADEKADRILKTYFARGNRSMGVMCSGRPGTGKTVLSKLTAIKAVEAGLPVIIIRQGFAGSGMTSFIESLPNKVMFFVDEIEKVYSDEDARNWLLTVLDGTVASHHLWVTTCNNANIGDAFENRPGRIRYHWVFNSMAPELIDGMIADKVKDENLARAINTAAMRLPGLTPDVLATIIEEALIYNEVPKEFLPFMNISSSMPDNFKVKGIASIATANSVMTKIERNDEAKSNDSYKDFIRCAREYGLEGALEDYPEFQKFIDYEYSEVEQDYAHQPIKFDISGNPSVALNLYPKNTPIGRQRKLSTRCEWHSDEIKASYMIGKTIVVEHVDGRGKLEFTPVTYKQTTAADYLD